MTFKALLTIGILSLLTLQTEVHATPSTQIWIPSTDVQPYLNPHLGWDIYQSTVVNALNTANGGITMGVLPFQKVGMEVGIDYRDINGDHTNPVYFNAKIGVPEDAFFKYMPAIAVGGFDFGTKKDVTTYNLLYGLAAKTFGKVGRISVGGFKGAVGSDSKLFRAASDSTKVDDAGLLLSYDRTLTEISDKLWFGIDYQSGKSGYGATSFGLQWNFAPNMSTIFGYDIWNDGTVVKPTFTLQFDINLK
jgi:hypothetical protein